MGCWESLSFTSYELVWRISKGHWQLFKALQGAEHAEVPIVSNMCMCAGMDYPSLLVWVGLGFGWASSMYQWLGRTTGKGFVRWLFTLHMSCSSISKCNSFLLITVATCSCSIGWLSVRLWHKCQDCWLDWYIRGQGWRCVVENPLCRGITAGEWEVVMFAAWGCSCKG